MIAKYLTVQRIQNYLPQAMVLHAEQMALQEDVPLKNIVTDSRLVGQGDFFVAIKGEKFDAHDFLNQVKQQGAIGALISNQELAPTQFTSIVVPDTVQALGTIAKAWRLETAPKVVVVTGSNGKTTVKEMIACIFQAAVGSEYALATQGNFNNEIGLPLTLLRLNSDHQLAVIELGMNHPGETRLLAEIAAPDVALINNAQREHQEFMQSVEAVASEHALAIAALSKDGYAVFPRDSEYANIWRSTANGRACLEFELVPLENLLTSSADVVGAWNAAGNLEIKAKTWLSSICIQLQTMGDHNAKNAIAATAACIAAGVSLEAITLGLEKFQAVSGRMRKLDRQFDQLAITLIDDTYNANPDSVIAAIEAIEKLPGQHWLILGDMGEVGNQGPAFHQEIGVFARDHLIDTLITTGLLTRETQLAFQQQNAVINAPIAQHFDEMSALTNYLQQKIQEKIAQKIPLVILVKGSRFTKMERVIEFLDKMPGMQAKEPICS